MKFYKRGLLFFGLLTLVSIASADIYARLHGPKGRLIYAKAPFIWEVWSTVPGEITGGRCTIDDQSVPARYDETARRVIANLQEPLSPGIHKITLSATLKTGEAIGRTWEFEIAPEALISVPAPNDSQNKVLGFVNSFREKMGLPACRMDDLMNAASLKHCEYLALNQTTGHYQTPGKQGYFGNQPWERLQAMGLVLDSWETVDFGSSTEEEALAHLIDAPYHRLAFIQPGKVLFGSGYHKNRLTATFQMSSEKGVVTYPYDKQEAVPPAWDYNERPNPLRIHDGARRPVGYPIMLARFGGGEDKLNVRLATIFDGDGREVPCWLNTPDNDPELKFALILIPKAPLKGNAKYSVRVEAAMASGEEVSRSWSFRTGPLPARFAKTAGGKNGL